MKSNLSNLPFIDALLEMDRLGIQYTVNSVNTSNNENDDRSYSSVFIRVTHDPSLVWSVIDVHSGVKVTKEDTDFDGSRKLTLESNVYVHIRDDIECHHAAFHNPIPCGDNDQYILMVVLYFANNNDAMYFIDSFINEGSNENVSIVFASLGDDEVLQHFNRIRHDGIRYVVHTNAKNFLGHLLISAVHSSEDQQARELLTSYDIDVLDSIETCSTATFYLDNISEEDIDKILSIITTTKISDMGAIWSFTFHIFSGDKKSRQKVIDILGKY